MQKLIQKTCPSSNQNLQKTAALPGRLFCCFLVQTVLLLRQGAPRLFHTLKGKFCLFVFSAFGKEGTVLSVITENIRRTHTAYMGRSGPVSTGLFREMFVRLGSQARMK